MIERVLRTLAIVLSLIIATSFCLFVVDQSEKDSKQQISKLDNYIAPDPGPAGEQAREQRDGALREHIDDADDILLRPFTGIVSSGTALARRGVPTLLGLFVYGFGLGYLSRFMRGRGTAPALGYKPRRS